MGAEVCRVNLLERNIVLNSGRGGRRLYLRTVREVDRVMGALR